MPAHNYETPYVVMGVGMPGSGKTTALKPFAKEMGAAYLCADDIREELTGDADNQAVNKEAWELLYTRAEEKLRDGESLVVDATHAERRYRREAVERYRNFGAKTLVAIYFEIDVAQAFQRLEGRERKVPLHVLERMNQSLRRNPVSPEDGFDDIIKLPQ